MSISGTTTPEGHTVVSKKDERIQTSKHLPPKLLHSTEYKLWSMKMKLHLQSLGVFDIVTNERPTPTGDASADERKTYNKDKSRAHSDLLRCLGPEFEVLASTFDTAADIWTCLKELCEQPKGAELLKIQQEIEHLQTSEPVSTSLVSLKRLLRQLEQYGGTMTANQKTIKLLTLLPDSFRELKLNVQTTDQYKVTVGTNPPVPTDNFDFEKVSCAW